MAPPSRNDIREAAARFAHDWHDESRERGEAQTFWTELLHVFGVERRRANAAFERHARRASTGRGGFIDLLWPRMLLAEHKSRGADLDAAMAQALDYVDGLDAKELPRFVVVSDFARMRVRDLDDSDGAAYEFPLLELPQQIDRLLALAGYTSRRFEDEAAVNVRAAELLGRVYDEIAATGYDPHALRVFMVRVLFLLFADDTGLWSRRQFADLIRDRSAADGSDLGMWVGRLFTVLDTPEHARTTALDEDLAAFPYVDGGLFAEAIVPPDTTRSMRERLLEASAFDWSQISPAVFGSLFQWVTSDTERRRLGAHYTSESNIFKLIRPLFLDALEAELAGCRTPRTLRAFHARLGTLRFLDPACGCGNFLVIAYRELRRLEREALLRLHAGDVQMTTDLEDWRKVSLEQFSGIELEEFPARIAQTAMYLADHLENEALARDFGIVVPELPLTGGARIVAGNALELDWEDVLPAAECSYLLGNPPYTGKHLLGAAQRADLERVLGDHRQAGSLDYLTGWLVRAAGYLAAGPHVRGAFVTTNSITQGEQVPALWPLLHERGLHLTFAWRTFNWTSEAPRAAHVHVVIVGFARGEAAGAATLYELDPESGTSIAQRARTLNGYLVPGEEVYPAARSQPLDPSIPPVVYGAKPADGGHLLLSAGEAAALRAADPIAAAYLRPLLSATEFLNGAERFCLWLEDAPPGDVHASPALRERLAAVRAFRERSTKRQTREMADRPGVFAEVRRPRGGFVFVPRHASAARRLIPMGLVPAGAEAVVHDSGAYVESTDLALFGLLQSEMFAAWQRTVGGRIKSDYRFNNRLVYNTFPFPHLSDGQRAAIAEGAQAVLAARAAHPEASLAELYQPIGAPSDLVLAHRQLDAAVDATFGRRRRLAEAERLALLFDRYVETTAEGPAPATQG
jgi:hypothetical protein